MEFGDGPIVGLGNALVDVIAPVEPEAIARHGLKSGGMHLVERAAAEALYDEVGPGLRQSGGSVANSVAHLRALRLPCAYVGKIAEDALGAVFAQDMKSLGVAFATPPLKNGAGTGRCVVLVTPDGERTMSTYLGAAQALSPADVEAAMPANLSLLLVEGYLWDSPDGARTIAAAAARARAAGARIALTPSDAGCVARHRGEMLAFVGAECDILIGNQLEVCALSGTEAAEDALRWACGQVDIAAVTMSEEGSLVADGREAFLVDAATAERVVDTTGAGDAYAAGFLGGLVSGRDLEAAARFGADLAATVVAHPGARRAEAGPGAVH